MGDFEKRLEIRAEENRRIVAERSRNYDYMQTIERRNQFVRNINETLRTLEKYDWPAGPSPYYTGARSDSVNHPEIDWGICMVSNEEIAYWVIYKVDAWKNDGYESRQSGVGTYILLRDGRVGFLKWLPKRSEITVFGYPEKPIRNKDRPGSFTDSWGVDNYTDGSDTVQGFHFNLIEYEEGLKELREKSQKWATP